MKRMKKRMWILGLMIGIIGTVYLNSAIAADYPTKPIEYICPFGAGGPTSLMNRVIGDKLAKILGQPVVVINKPGAGGAIAAAYIARAKPDGYTIGDVTSAGNGVTVALRPDVTYKNSDFDILGKYGTMFLAMAVKEDAPWKTVKDLAEYARKNPGVLKYGSSGVGSATQLCMELFKLTAGKLKIDHIPFKSGPEITAALLGGHIHTGTFTWGTVKAAYEAKQVRVLALSIPVEELPELPSFAQAGFPEVNLTGYYGTAAPKGLPKDVYNKLRQACAETFQDPKTREALRNIGLTPDYKPPEEFAKFLEDQIILFKRIGREANIKLD